MSELLRSAWRYRHFILSSVKNDLKARFARSRLGAAWMVLQPLAQVAIYSLVLSRVMGAKLPGVTNQYAYSIYLMAGMLAWSLFVEVVQRSLTLFVDNGNLMKKIYFPRVCLPFIAVGTALVSNVLLFAATVAIFALVGHFPTSALVWLPVLVVVNVAFSLGLGLLLGVINVFVRDVGQVMAVVIQLWFWITPIVYMPSILPHGFGRIIELNPLYYIVGGFQDVMLFDRTPNLVALGWTALGSLVLLALAFMMFRKAAPEMVDVL
ncbi:ABC transporter [Luteibacter rhizovicinus DSM 16549]|uniref:Transport permease protein n=1 Tax=Luteibacter rhizovicinus DSM 16549 TaxID=1440763 RepID=A0A0G9HF52_9GAMM|nr:ABC transporter permease [Luteibacter rhizovicinus]APG04431.1 ABC transporter [Luteibacter rhizovicinus DSM 16549]KLD66267.1 ABC transporter [Luteibacter rhizovicinus DSM 16549]